MGEQKSAADARASQGFSTRAIHAGYEPDPLTGAVNVPIYASSTFAQDGVGVMRDGFEYARTGNPTRRPLEANLAAVESGTFGRAFASGMGAIAAVFLSLLSSGDEVLLLGPLYGGTRGLLEDMLPRFGVTARSVTDEQLAEAVAPNTRMIYVESPTNPNLSIHDLANVATVARRHGIVSVADSTFATPILTRPIEFGIDLVVHSATKYLGGHGDLLGGVVAGSLELLEPVRMEGLRHLGATLDPHVAFLLLRGMRTLHLRMAAHCSNAREVADALRGQPGVSAVYYPGFEDHPGHALAARQMSDFGGMVSVEFSAGLPAATAFLESLKTFDHGVSLGDVASLACHPASTTHQLLPVEMLEAEGVTAGLVRLSVGIEDPADLVEDVLQAARAAALVEVVA